ncbi:Protein EMBRYO DEFECTIVE 514 [Linum grandiflorum]
MATETNLEEAVKRVKEEIGSEANGGGSDDDVSKKRKRETYDVGEKGNTFKKEEVVWLGSVKFQTSREIVTYFDTLSRSWLLASDFNVIGKQYFPMLMDLVKKGDPELEKMIGSGVITKFHVKYTIFCSNRRVFYFTMNGTAHEFCFRSCVDNILALPDDLKEQDTGAVCKCHAPSPEPNEEEVILKARELDTSAKVYAYCFNTLYYFPPLNKPISKHDRLVLLELVKKWDPPMWENKFGCGSEVDQYLFEVRIHPMYVHSTGLRSFFIVDQRDGSVSSSLPRISVLYHRM